MKPDHWPRRSRVPAIAGVERIHLESHADAGGVSTQVFHREWQLGIHPVQWNAVHSEANVLRGVHVHVVHGDYLLLLKGQTLLGLRDLRPGSPTEGNTAVLELKAEQLEAVCIPPGVAHGFYFTRRSLQWARLRVGRSGARDSMAVEARPAVSPRCRAATPRRAPAGSCRDERTVLGEVT